MSTLTRIAPFGRQALKAALVATGAMGIFAFSQQSAQAVDVGVASTDFEADSAGSKGSDFSSNGNGTNHDHLRFTDNELEVNNYSKSGFSDTQALRHESGSSNSDLGIDTLFQDPSGNKLAFPKAGLNFGVDLDESSGFGPNDADDAEFRFQLHDEQSGGSLSNAFKTVRRDIKAPGKNYPGQSISFAPGKKFAGFRIDVVNAGTDEKIDGVEEIVDNTKATPFGFSPGMGLGALGLLYGGMQLRRRFKRRQAS